MKKALVGMIFAVAQLHTVSEAITIGQSIRFTPEHDDQKASDQNSEVQSSSGKNESENKDGEQTSESETPFAAIKPDPALVEQKVNVISIHSIEAGSGAEVVYIDEEGQEPSEFDGQPVSQEIFDMIFKPQVVASCIFYTEPDFTGDTRTINLYEGQVSSPSTKINDEEFKAMSWECEGPIYYKFCKKQSHCVEGAGTQSMKNHFWQELGLDNAQLFKFDPINYGKATLFKEHFCSGLSKVLSNNLSRDVESFLDFVSKDGVSDANIASIRVPGGYVVELYSEEQFQGELTRIEGEWIAEEGKDMVCHELENIKDTIKSIRFCEKSAETGELDCDKYRI